MGAARRATVNFALFCVSEEATASNGGKILQRFIVTRLAELQLGALLAGVSMFEAGPVDAVLRRMRWSSIP